ncbi:MAG: EAL domain-containing protein [Actinobacteria bacterium]|nr:EAL domain-containing protein [Actinomycetota bacterium]MCL5446835.1 EAL domain-containing protein [Actinomycetota bacterium]
MTITESGQGHDGNQQDVAGTVTSVIMRYVRNKCGDKGLIRMLQLAGECRSVEVLRDPFTWSSYSETMALISAAAQVCADNDISIHLGEEMLRQYDGTDVASLLRSLGSPAEVLKNVTAAAAKFFTVSSLEALEVGDAHAIVRAVGLPGYRRDAILCDFTKGLLSQVPVLFGLVPAVITESECAARGGRFCLYSVGWEEHQWSSFVDGRRSIYTMAWSSGEVDEAQAEIESDDNTKVSYLTAQVQQLTMRLQDVYSTAADLLATDDIDSVLARVTKRAAHAVSAPRYVLAIKLAPEQPVQLHHYGLTQQKAKRVAAEILLPEPDTYNGSRLIVDVRSRRQYYGRIAAIYPEGVQFLAQEKEALSVYANYAATALDMVTALDDARRSSATSSALLKFSRQLASLTTTAEVAEQLSKTVPMVVGCDTSAVLLWDDSTKTLRSVKKIEQGGSSNQDDPSGGLADGMYGNGAHGGNGDNHEFKYAEPVQDGQENGTGTVLNIPLSASPLIRRVVEARDIIFVDRTTNDSLVKDVLEHYDIQATLLAPIFTTEKCLGIVTANFKHAVQPASVNTKELRERVTGLSDQAAVSLENANLLQQISHMAWHDALTGLPNRRLLEDRANQALVHAARAGDVVCMFFVDLDHFKEVNDVLGHAAGDDLIIEVATRLSRTVRQQDTVARLGGDEFAILLPGLSDPEAIEALARRMLASLSMPFNMSGQEVYVTGSIGVAMAPRDGNTYDELLSSADAAMYRSKEMGKNTFQTFDAEEDRTSTPDSFHLEKDLHKALKRKELFVLYQPFIDLGTAKVVGVEALLRWKHPTRGTLEPATFIEIAEASDLIVQIDSWVISEACRQLRFWLDIGLPPLRIAINVSTRDLAAAEYVDSVLAALENNTLDPSLIELELTERVVFDNTGTMQANVERLQKTGVRFSADDFGTGSSGMDRLGSFPVSILKIDRSFVQVLGPDDQSQVIIQAIVGMAKDLGMTCVAEGVETSTQSRILLQRGCTTAQGFFFSPPLLAVDVERMLRSSARSIAVAGKIDKAGAVDGVGLSSDIV